MEKTIHGVKESDIPRSFYEITTKSIINYTVGIVKIHRNEGKETAVLSGSGTLIDVNGTIGLLTAQHVIDVLPSKGELGLIISERLHRPIFDAQLLQYVNICNKGPSSYGPDIGFIKLPQSVIGMLKATKSIYNISNYLEIFSNELPDEQMGYWCIAGIPEEKTIIEGPSKKFEAVMGFLLYCSFGHISDYRINNVYDYCDFHVTIKPNSQKPSDYRGVSGGGLWHVLIHRNEFGDIVPHRIYLSGLAFFQTKIVNNKRMIRCHGHRSIYQTAYKEILKNFS